MPLPSPKFHCQPVGLPVDWSRNEIDCCVCGLAGDQLNDAVSGALGALTVTMRVVEACCPPPVTVSVTVYAPAML
jgi:hypothetical protein